jgi:hypothetical protein
MANLERIFNSAHCSKARLGLCTKAEFMCTTMNSKNKRDILFFHLLHYTSFVALEF